LSQIESRFVWSFHKRTLEKSLKEISLEKTIESRVATGEQRAPSNDPATRRYEALGYEFIGPKVRRYIVRDKIANLLILLEHTNSSGTGCGDGFD